jgi:flagellar basal body rod protein FlgG
MPDGIRTNGMSSAASALRYWERRQEVTANNLANVSTTGFKAERAFAQMMSDALPTAQTSTDMRPGALKDTGSPMDVSIEKEGFFVVGTPGGERLSRGGSFHLDASRQLVDTDGNALLGEGGPIIVPDGAMTIDHDGAVKVEGRPVGRLRLERVDPKTELQHEGGTLFIPPSVRKPLADDQRTVRQGALEESNVSSVSALVDMIAVQRAYASVQKTVTTLDGIRGVISNELGKPV